MSDRDEWIYRGNEWKKGVCFFCWVERRGTRMIDSLCCYMMCIRMCECVCVSFVAKGFFVGLGYPETIRSGVLRSSVD